MQQSPQPLISIRQYLPGDHNFILATWLKGLRHGNEFYGKIDTQAYFESYRKAIEIFLDKPNYVVLVACLKDDPEVILGYSVYHTTDTGDTAFDWVFVKKDWRANGIARSLFPSNVSIVTHLTAPGSKILEKHPNIKFNPFAVN